MTVSSYQRRTTATPTRPSRVLDSAPTFRTVARYPTYLAAEQAFEHLKSLGVAPGDATIAGRDLAPAAATGRLIAWHATGRAAALGATSGGLLGALLGLLDVLPPAAAYIILSGMALGAVIGAAAGYLRHRMRDTASACTRLGGVRAEAYQIQVDTRHVDPERAEHQLARYWPM
ncbi:hypothetical protein [Dactylosporangium matsuzakiense]|uniref:Transmembrane protein n=1 Tax=Dactylosporangium matsuzakiense TaxID=53360 RepID=A0A9W6NK88_9ACTN|nr:hypothetical protein [Dactylosporangium matsuzakiense]UWZ42225.1 hypothetical protein Dmats_32220 [Dactylosporangium matsuzakiense]GLK99875.1 hypothetical protein GCM10017581_016160 [Dactylosporangium matsuzakiense]